MENIDAKLHVRLLQLSNQTAGKTGKQTVLHALQVDRGAVTGQDNLPAHAEEVIKDMEERVECLGRVHPLLDVINNQHINRLVEVDEIIGRVMTHGIRELHLEQSCRDIKHPFLGIGLLATYTDSVDQMGLTTTGRTVDEEGIEGTLAWMLCYGEANGTRQFVGIALDKVLEGLLHIKLGIQLLRCDSIEC